MKRVFLGWTQEPFPHYIAALERLGLTVERRNDADCDALLLPGGGDVDPRLYGQRPDGAREIDRARDAYELALFRRFMRTGRPVFGVCRGMQLVNVALGGTLRQHIEGHDRVYGADRRHAVRAGDEFLRALRGGRFIVNSAHHQCVDRLGDGLRATAWAEDGTVEALRHDTLPILAVQWHPERLGAEGARLLAAMLADP